jgi:opacity protein-like surface antigen
MVAASAAVKGGIQMDRIRILLAATTALVLLPGLAAADDDDFSRRGVYLGIGGIYTQNGQIEDEIEDAVPPIVDKIEVDDSAGFNALVGYRLFPVLAAELQYEYVDGFDLKATVGPATQKIEIQSHLVTANLKAILPIWRVQPYLLGGAGVIRWEFDESGPLPNFFSSGETDFAARAGGGIDFYLTRNIVLNAGANVVIADTSVPPARCRAGGPDDPIRCVPAASADRGAGLCVARRSR